MEDYKYETDLFCGVFAQVVVREAIELLLERSYIIHTCRYGISISKQGDPIIQDNHGYVIMTELSQDFRDYCSNRFLVELFYDSDYDLKKVFFAIGRTD